MVIECIGTGWYEIGKMEGTAEIEEVEKRKKNGRNVLQEIKQTGQIDMVLMLILTIVLMILKDVITDDNESRRGMNGLKRAE
jgi:hypothetical protein